MRRGNARRTIFFSNTLIGPFSKISEYWWQEEQPTTAAPRIIQAHCRPLRKRANNYTCITHLLQQCGFFIKSAVNPGEIYATRSLIVEALGPCKCATLKCKFGMSCALVPRNTRRKQKNEVLCSRSKLTLNWDLLNIIYLLKATRSNKGSNTSAGNAAAAIELKANISF